jgi:hypothetical protein
VLVWSVVSAPLASLEDDASYYRQSADVAGQPPSAAKPIAVWDFSFGLTEQWTALPGTDVRSSADGTAIRTNTRPLDYQLMGPTLSLAAGRYAASVVGSVGLGGLELGVLRTDPTPEWIVTTHYFDRQFAGKALPIVSRFSLAEPTTVRVILSNWAQKETSSEWVIKLVRLDALP